MATEVVDDGVPKESRKIADPNDENQINEVVETIVDKWNNLVEDVENTTIKLCTMINDMVKDYPQETTKNILQKVKQHPNVKRFVSLDRIWQGMRLIKRRPELLEYHQKSEEEKKQTSEEEKPYVKSDGRVFWEFYFELAKQPLSEGTIEQIEQDAKEEKWSFRDLRQNLKELKEQSEQPLGHETTKKEKQELIREITGMLKEFSVEQLRGIKTFCQEQNKNE